MPLRQPQHLPKFDIAEITEKIELAQRIEFLGLRHTIAGFRTGSAQHINQISGKIPPGLITIDRIFLQHAQHDGIDLRRHLIVEAAGGRRVHIDDLINDAVGHL